MVAHRSQTIGPTKGAVQYRMWGLDLPCKRTSIHPIDANASRGRTIRVLGCELENMDIASGSNRDLHAGPGGSCNVFRGPEGSEDNGRRLIYSSSVSSRSLPRLFGGVPKGQHLRSLSTQELAEERSRGIIGAFTSTKPASGNLESLGPHAFGYR
jgi:hypothetical protein